MSPATEGRKRGRRSSTYEARLRSALLVAIALLLSACAESAGEYSPVTVTADAEKASPLPDAADSGAAPGEAAEYAPLDLSLLGENASSSELPSAVPAGLEVGFTEEGYPYRGSPEATVTLVEYSDYACPFCGRYTAENVPALLEQYVATGQVRFIFRDFPLVSIHPTAPAAHVAAHCAGEESAEQYWQVHDEIFLRQAEWTGLPDPSDFFGSLVQGLGVDMAAYEECAASGRHDALIDEGVAEARELGFNGTPSFRFEAEALEDDYTLIGAAPLETFTGYLDSLLAGEPPPGESDEEAEDEGLPYWADVAGGLLPDPDRPGVNMAGDQYKGNPDAEIVVIEFSDFQCPFCRDHALEVQPAVDEALVDTGRVLWVYKHLPLSIHPLAPLAGAAAECASDQGRFWEMHERLFETVDAWTVGDAEALFTGLASELALDVAAFETCLAGRSALERVVADQADAAGIITQTPSFAVIQGEQGSIIQGLRPADEFIRAIEGYFAATGGSESGG